MSHKLVIAVIVLSALLVAGSLPLSVSSGQATTKTPIKHLVVLMMENHSFDNLFGTYGQLSNGTVAPNVTMPVNLITHPVKQNLTAISTGTFSTGDPAEGYNNYHTDWNNGSMNGFLNGSGPVSLNYYTVSQMGPEWYLAHQYALADMYFSSMLSETLPNRLYSLAGFSPVKSDFSTPPPFIPYDQTIFNEMDHYNVSWSYYFQNPDLGFYPLDFISGMTSHFSNLKTWGSFTGAVQNGTLPSVSWVSPISGLAYGYSQHPPDNVLAGEIWLFYMVHLIMTSKYWNNTAIMITYDEGGGFYDQVAPPTVNGHQLGFRVPFILISPYAKENYVSNTVMSHTSILGFIDYNWNMPALNQLVLHSNLPLDMFNLATPYSNNEVTRPPLSFNSTFNAFLPSRPADSTSLAGNFHNVSYVFPGKLQYNTSTLPYNSNGSSVISLSNTSQDVYVTHNFGFTPWYLNPYITFPAAIAAIAGIGYAIYRYIKKRRRMKKEEK